MSKIKKISIKNREKNNKKKIELKKNLKKDNFLYKIINSRNLNIRNISEIHKSNTILNNKDNIANTLFKNYRNNSCNIRNQKKDNKLKNNNLFCINKNNYKFKNQNNSSINRNLDTFKGMKNNNRNEFITINNNYYTIISNTTVNNININENLYDEKFDNINKKDNNFININIEKNFEPELKKDNISANNNKSKIKNENEISKSKIKVKKPICSIKMPIKKDNVISRTNYSTYIHNNSINKKSKDIYNINNDISSPFKDIFSINFNTNKSRNQSSLRNQFNTNNNIINISYYKEKKNNFLNNSTYSEKRQFNKGKLNLSGINRRKKNDLNNKKRIIKIKPKNDNIKLSLKQKIHLFYQRKEALIKQYSNKNKVEGDHFGSERKIIYKKK